VLLHFGGSIESIVQLCFDRHPRLRLGVWSQSSGIRLQRCLEAAFSLEKIAVNGIWWISDDVDGVRSAAACSREEKAACASSNCCLAPSGPAFKAVAASFDTLTPLTISVSEIPITDMAPWIFRLCEGGDAEFP
jgi:hypothetical protein